MAKTLLKGETAKVCKELYCVFTWFFLGYSFLFLFRYKTNFIFFYSTADCFLSGERVKISTSSEYHKYEDTFACATVEDNICSNSTEWFDLTFDDGYQDAYKYIDLTACVDQGKWIFINYLNAKSSNIMLRMVCHIIMMVNIWFQSAMTTILVRLVNSA